MPRRGHTTGVAAAGLFVAIFMLAPFLGTNSAITSCQSSSCQTSTGYYQSACFSVFGVGGVYIPQSKGWGIFGTGTVHRASRSSTSGISLRQFYIVW